MSTLYLVRHGQASAGTHDYDRLSTLGQQQSRLLGNWWCKQGFEPDVVHHGSLVRQRDTAILTLDAIGHTVSRNEHCGLNEYDHRGVDAHFGGGCDSEDPESITFEDYTDIMHRWRDDKLVAAHTVEPWADFSQRGWNTVRELHRQDNHRASHVFFSSAGVIGTILSAALKRDFTFTIDAIWKIRNTSITTIEFNGQQARLVDFNAVPHLQNENNPALITLI